MFLKEFREILQLTQKELADKLGVAQTTVARYETDKVSPTTNTIMKYIEKVDANPLFLFTGKEPAKLSYVPDINTESLNLLNDLRLIMDHNEVHKELEELFVKETVAKFQISNEKKLPIYKLLEAIKIEGCLPERPFLLLYYIYTLIVQDKKVELIASHREYLIHIILSCKTLSWHNNPIFSSKIKDEISARFELELSESESKVLVQNAKIALKILEKEMPASMIVKLRKQMSQ